MRVVTAAGRSLSAEEAKGGYAGLVGHRLLVSINATRARPWAMLVDVDIAEFGGRTAVPLIVICQCAVVRRVVAP